MGCYFHFKQSVLRWAAANGLSKQYQEHGSDVRKTIRRCLALALLPIHLVVPAFDNVKTSCLVPTQLREFFAYFDRVWMKNPAVWNVYGQSIRTNNHVEQAS